MTKVFGEQDRAELVSAVKRGESVPAAARRFGIARSTVYAWIRRAGASQMEMESAPAAPPRFLELVAGRDSEAGLLVRVGAAEIHVRAGFNVELLEGRDQDSNPSGSDPLRLCVSAINFWSRILPVRTLHVRDPASARRRAPTGDHGKKWEPTPISRRNLQ